MHREARWRLWGAPIWVAGTIKVGRCEARLMRADRPPASPGIETDIPIQGGFEARLVNLVGADAAVERNAPMAP